MTARAMEIRGRSKVEKAAAALLDAHLTPVGLDLSDPSTPFDVYETIGHILGRWRDVTSWALGDWLLFGEGTYGERYAQAVEATKRSKATLQDYARVALLVPRSRRRAELTFHHHRLVARQSMVASEQDRWLDEALERGWSVEEMAGAMHSIQGNADGGSGGGNDGFVDERRVVEVAIRIAREANPLIDGGYRVDAELMAQLRAAAGVER